jgi:hypothetical protein
VTSIPTYQSPILTPTTHSPTIVTLPPNNNCPTCIPQPSSRHLRELDAQPCDPYASAFVAEAGECWRMVHDANGQATHCAQEPTHTGRWLSPRSDGTWWRVWSCEGDIDGLTGLREFGLWS